MAYKTPIQRSVCPDTDPQAASVGRDEELLATEQEGDIGGGQPEGDRRPSVDPLERSKRPFTGAEVRMTPRTNFTGLRERETQVTKTLKYAVGSSQTVDVRHTLSINPIECPRSENH